LASQSHTRSTIGLIGAPIVSTSPPSCIAKVPSKSTPIHPFITTFLHSTPTKRGQQQGPAIDRQQTHRAALDSSLFPSQPAASRRSGRTRHQSLARLSRSQARSTAI